MCQPKGQVWPLERNHSKFFMLGVLMVVGDFVSDQGTSKSLRIVIPCNFFLCLISLRTCAYHTKDQLHPKGGNTSNFFSMFEALIVVNVQLKIKY